VLGEDSRSGLAVVRSLGRKGVPIVLGVQSDQAAVAAYSRYVSQVIQMPSTWLEVEAWLAAVERFLKSEQIDLVISCSDSTIIPLVRERARFEQLSRLTIPDRLGFEYTFLKSKTLEMASELGVPVPPTFFIADKSALSRIQPDRLRFPVVVKPISSKVWKDGVRFDLKVVPVRDFPDMARVAEEMLDVQPVLIQETFHGVGVGQEFLAREGEILSAFQHERVHEPVGGGGSSYRKSVPLDSRMLECSRRMLAHLRWSGVAMVEYRSNPATGEFTLIEINGRFWGSLPLAVAAGVDFPYQLLRLLVHGEIPRSTPYRLGLFSRNLQKDLGWFKERIVTSGSRSDKAAMVAGEALMGFKRTLASSERFDELVLDDPLPAVRQAVKVLTSLSGKAYRFLRNLTVAILASSPYWRRLQRERLRRLLELDPRLLFVCRGNICRSPFAEQYAKLRLASLGNQEIETLSAGTYRLERRVPPKLARHASLKFGVGLDDHRSRVLRRNHTTWAGAIVCMDLRDFHELRTAFPEVRNKLFLLRPFDVQSPGYEISDPWGKAAEDFHAEYTNISASVEGLIQSLVH
jgi:protein-tyrosine-phosphatase/predicted ATP-grasp superfamily ATP-dependent carboligase